MRISPFFFPSIRHPFIHFFLSLLPFLCLSSALPSLVLSVSPFLSSSCLPLSLCSRSSISAVVSPVHRSTDQDRRTDRERREGEIPSSLPLIPVAGSLFYCFCSYDPFSSLTFSSSLIYASGERWTAGLSTPGRYLCVCVCVCLASGSRVVDAFVFSVDVLTIIKFLFPCISCG